MKKYFLLFITIYLPYNLFALNIDPINKLNNGALLVRLQTNQNLINHYLQLGEYKQAADEKEQQYKNNQDIIKFFEQEWTLCPVYFFYSNHSKEVKNNMLSNVFCHKNIKLTKEEQNRIKNNFLITYIGKNRGSLKFHCLALVNQDFSPLPPPAPRYVRTYKGLWLLTRKLSKTIRILQKKIEFHLSRKI